MAYFIKNVLSCQDRHLGTCPQCSTRMRFQNAVVCYPCPGKYLPRFPEPVDCSGADIRCPECETLVSFRMAHPEASVPQGLAGRFSRWLARKG